MLITNYKAFQHAYIWNYFDFLKAKGQDNLQDKRLILIYTDIYIYLNSWKNLSKVKVNRQEL